MHLADPSLGILGANGVVAAGIPIAAGAALAAQINERGQVAVAFFGEGALHTGAFHEAVTLAVAWRLPMLLLCESNGWVEFTRADAWGGPEPAARGAAYGLLSDSIDGSDVTVVLARVEEVLETVRSGAGPAFLEVKTVRAGGHYEGDAQAYRPEDAVVLEATDPLLRSRDALGLTEDEAKSLVHAAEAEMETAAETALKAPYPSPASLMEDVYA
jgi:TPP-dependent pyruvate/acetoin dehydrogenase alpha subunit